jgi:restriction system protein
MMNKITERSLTILLPTYTNARHFLRILQGVSESQYHNMFDAIWDLRGSPQEQVDWKDPDTWIPERLNIEQQRLAKRIWDASGRELNPRYLRPVRRFVKQHNLQKWPTVGALQLTERGRRFMNEPEGQVVAEIDQHEGLLNLLRLLADVGPGKRGDFLPSFTSFCKMFTTSRGASSISRALGRRLANLVERNYVQRRYHVYEITERGSQYLGRHTNLVIE